MNNGVGPKSAIFCCAALAALATLCFPATADPLSVPAKPTIIMVEKAGGHTTYKVDSKRVGHASMDNMLYVLNEVAHRNGKDHPVLIYLDPRLPIEEIWNLNGVAGKAQLDNLRYFVFFRQNQMITEMKWTPFSPFTTSPPAN
jgi:hypothetical protein